MSGLRWTTRLTTAAVLVGAFAVLPGAAAASATDSGVGCVGAPEIPETYVCVLELEPAHALPTVTADLVRIDVPTVCVLITCTAPTAVVVPVPVVERSSGTVVVVGWNGDTYTVYGDGSAEVGLCLLLEFPNCCPPRLMPVCQAIGRA